MLTKIPSEITKITTMSNGALRIQVDSQENIHPEDKARIMELHEKLGVFVFAEALKDEDLLDLPEVKIEKSDKTPSQRLRAVLYRLWETTDKKRTSDEFYLYYIDHLIEQIKEKLPNV